MTSAKSTIEPASITHHSLAIAAAAGPEGSSVDSGPVQPDERRNRAKRRPACATAMIRA